MEFENENLWIQIHPSATTRSLPREIVLLILEALVARAVADDNEIAYYVSFEEDPKDPKAGAKLDVCIVGLRLPGYYNSQTLRFSRIRAPLRINRFTHALTRQHYFPYPMTDNPSRLITGWFRPAIDLFMLRIPQHFERLSVEDAPGLWLDNSPERPFVTSMQKAVEHPSPHDAEFVRGMQIMYKEHQGLFHQSSKPELQLMFSLPNLREIHIGLGALEREEGVIEPPEPPHSHLELQPIDEALYPHLARCKYDQSEIFDACARRAEERGIKIFCIDDREGFNGYEKRAELLRTPDGVRMRYLQPECTCYDGLAWEDSDEACEERVNSRAFGMGDWDEVTNASEEDVNESEEDTNESDDDDA